MFEQSNLDRVLQKFKLPNLDFFDTRTLTHPAALDIPDANNDLERELQLYVSACPAYRLADCPR